MNKLAGVTIQELFQTVRAASKASEISAGNVRAATGMMRMPINIAMMAGGPALSNVPMQGEQDMAAFLEGQRRATAEATSKNQNLERMRAHTQAQLGIGLAGMGMGYNPMLAGGGAPGAASPFITWSDRMS